jgi:hemoglobin
MRATRFSFGFSFGLLLVCLCLVTRSASAGTLYDDLGGNAGLTAIVSDTVDASVADPRTADKLDNINIARLKERIVIKICEMIGGPCHFHGISMKGAHAYLHLQDRHFNALVENMQDAMDRHGIPSRTQNRLLAVLAPLHRDIVSK